MKSLASAALCLFIASITARPEMANASTDATATLRAGSGMESNAVGRDWLKYIVRCAMPAGTSINISREGEPQIVEGSFGLAPDWAHASLSAAGKRWVSACVLGFVNALGEHVLVSMRGAQPNLKSTVSDEERRDFTYQEAAFYGDIFASTPVAYVCRGKGGAAESPSRAKRLCSDPSAQPGISRCGMIITGACADVCDGEDTTDHFFTHCRGGDRDFDEVVTVFLPTSR